MPRSGTVRGMYFYPRSPCGERRYRNRDRAQLEQFLSTLSLRRATDAKRGKRLCYTISIHALLAESDCAPSANGGAASKYFYPRSPCGERHSSCTRSTWSYNFYPRSPCGERRRNQAQIHRSRDFYPRSPCGERLFITSFQNINDDFYPRSPCGERPRTERNHLSSLIISIHALLAESDRSSLIRVWMSWDFYPRSPCGERPRAGSPRLRPRKYFYPRSPCGERLSLILWQHGSR